MFTRTLGSILLLSLVVTSACGGAEADAGVGAAHDGPGTEDALDEDSVLEFLNGPDATEHTLVQDVRISTRAAHNIVLHVRGVDLTLGTRDDDLLDDIDELDAIPQVGPATIEALKAYVRAHNAPVDLVVEGVELSRAQADAMVRLANSASEALLDDDVGLDARAAAAIVAARPLADIHALAAVSYVAATALTRLRDYVIAHPSPAPGADVRVVDLAASKGFGIDPYWEESNDGVFLSWSTENATACTAELFNPQGGLLATRGPDRDLPTSATGYFFGELGNYGGEVDVRMTCVGTGGSDAMTVRAGAGPGVVQATAAVVTAHDDASQSDRDGAQVSWQCERSVRAALEVVSLAGESLALQEGAETMGERFIPVWAAGEGEEVDVKVMCTDAVGATFEHFVRATVGGVAPGVDCATLDGGTFDGVAFSAAEECTAVTFLNEARFSQMGALPDNGRRVAYDCAPNGTCGFRSSLWTELSQYAGFSGVGGTSLSGLKAAIATWTPGGLRWDTVVDVWTNRATLRDQPVNLDSVYVVRRLADQGTSTPYACAEVRDAAGAPNFITACLAWGHDSSPIINAGDHIDGIVGTRVSLRGTLRQSSSSTGGYRITLSPQGAGAANPAVP